MNGYDKIYEATRRNQHYDRQQQRIAPEAQRGRLDNVTGPTMEQWLEQRDEDYRKTMRNIMLQVIFFAAIGAIGLLAILTLTCIMV